MDLERVFAFRPAGVSSLSGMTESLATCRRAYCRCTLDWMIRRPSTAWKWTGRPAAVRFWPAACVRTRLYVLLKPGRARPALLRGSSFPVRWALGHLDRFGKNRGVVWKSAHGPVLRALLSCVQ